MSKMLSKLKAVGWSFSLAWRFNKKVLVGWLALVSVVSVLPAVALAYNRVIMLQLNEFLYTGEGVINDILPVLIMFGIITALIGLSNRLNSDFLYSVMYDSYYFGIMEMMADGVQECSMEELLKNEARSEIFGVVIRQSAIMGVLSGVFSLISKLIGTVSLLVIAISASTLIFVFSLVYIITIIWINLTFVEKLRDTRYVIRDMERIANHYENMPYSEEYAKELRVFESKDTLLKSWKEACVPIFNINIKMTLSQEIRSIVSGLGFYIFLIIMIVYSLFTVAYGNMTAADLIIIYALSMNMFSTVTGIARSLLNIDGSIHNVEQQKTFVERKKGGASGGVIRPNSGENVFKTENLSYHYKEGILVLDDVSIEIKRGEVVALVGANGSGKTTLVSNLMQLYRPQSGKRFHNGVEYDELEPGYLKDNIGVFFQQYYKFHVPIWEYVGFGDINNVNDMDKITRALEKGGAMGFVMKLPQKMDTYNGTRVEKTGGEFSGGERQKLAVSRAHMSNKDILVFDEPASMLDPISEMEQFTHIKEKLEGKTAILISHRVGFARLADKIIVMDGGKVAETGTHSELIEKNGLYATFFNEQAQWYQKTEE